MLISRIIQPIVWQPYSTEITGGEFGFGDMSPTFFLSPASPGKLIWGVGPAWAFPTATSNLLGQGKVSVGPSVVALLQPGRWTLGTLVNNVWSFAGSGGRPEVNQMTAPVLHHLQPARRVDPDQQPHHHRQLEQRGHPRRR